MLLRKGVAASGIRSGQNAGFSTVYMLICGNIRVISLEIKSFFELGFIGPLRQNNSE
jgi:hypothetical protein